jgi:hypothetical protein
MSAQVEGVEELSYGAENRMRNPLLLMRTKPTLQRIRRDPFGAVYAASALNLRQEFGVLQGEVA